MESNIAAAYFLPAPEYAKNLPIQDILQQFPVSFVVLGDDMADVRYALGLAFEYVRQTPPNENTILNIDHLCGKLAANRIRMYSHFGLLHFSVNERETDFALFEY